MSNERFSYLRATRSNVPLEQLSSAQMGHMLHSLIDSIHRVMLLDEMHNIPEDKTNLSEFKIQALPPDFILESISDWRAASTFFINSAKKAFEDDPVQPTAVNKAVGATHVANIMHGVQRAKAGDIARHIKWPDNIRDMIGKYDDLVKEYRDLAKKYGSYTDIPAIEAGDHQKRFEQHFEALKTALLAMDSLTLESEGKTYTISNKISLTDTLKDCTPATLLFFLKDVPKGAADPNKRPPTGWVMMKQFGGARSQISDMMTRLQEHIEGEVNAKLDLFKMHKESETIRASLKQEARSMQLLHQVIGIMGDMYPQAQADIERLLGFIEQPVNIDALQTPKEAAFLLYSAARSMELHGCTDKQLLGEMTSLAQELAVRSSFEDIGDKAPLLQIASQVSSQIREPFIRHNITAALDLITHSVSAKDEKIMKARAGTRRHGL